ncbi:hypothetical protein PR202_gb18952 [Eleusine coracana subsp. coracana]|uniref:Uncharacterized protein n=1 Tax=Eleusine coracana subsp. coracana TaxID=191504 RepID=A0AAV5F8I7_ELECO|nr:hypothetical protein PR202_gb18952 [Eleusine coracana subsp. coracana]
MKTLVDEALAVVEEGVGIRTSLLRRTVPLMSDNKVLAVVQDEGTGTRTTGARTIQEWTMKIMIQHKPLLEEGQVLAAVVEEEVAGIITGEIGL